MLSTTHFVHDSTVAWFFVFVFSTRGGLANQREKENISVWFNHIDINPRKFKTWENNYSANRPGYKKDCNLTPEQNNKMQTLKWWRDIYSVNLDKRNVVFCLFNFHNGVS